MNKKILIKNVKDIFKKGLFLKLFNFDIDYNINISNDVEIYNKFMSYNKYFSNYPYHSLLNKQNDKNKIKYLKDLNAINSEISKFFLEDFFIFVKNKESSLFCLIIKMLISESFSDILEKKLREDLNHLLLKKYKVDKRNFLVLIKYLCLKHKMKNETLNVIKNYFNFLMKSPSMFELIGYINFIYKTKVMSNSEIERKKIITLYFRKLKSSEKDEFLNMLFVMNADFLEYLTEIESIKKYIIKFCKKQNNLQFSYLNFYGLKINRKKNKIKINNKKNNGFGEPIFDFNLERNNIINNLKEDMKEKKEKFSTFRVSKSNYDLTKEEIINPYGKIVDFTMNIYSEYVINKNYDYKRADQLTIKCLEERINEVMLCMQKNNYYITNCCLLYKYLKDQTNKLNPQLMLDLKNICNFFVLKEYKMFIYESVGFIEKWLRKILLDVGEEIYEKPEYKYKNIGQLLVEKKGINISTQHNIKQNDKYNPETQYLVNVNLSTIYNKGLIFELYFFLNHEYGYNLRNEIAHYIYDFDNHYNNEKLSFYLLHLINRLLQI